MQSSLPQSLKDSQEEISAVKNQSRYADDSVTMNVSYGKQGHNITHEQHMQNARVNKLNLKAAEEFKGPQHADSSTLRISAAKHPRNTSNSQRPSNTGGNLFKKGDVTPYSFADGLDMHLVNKELKSQQNRGSIERKRDQNHEEYLDDYMLSTAIGRKESQVAKINPFDVVTDDRNQDQKTAQNR